MYVIENSYLFFIYVYDSVYINTTGKLNYTKWLWKEIGIPFKFKFAWNIKNTPSTLMKKL